MRWSAGAVVWMVVVGGCELEGFEHEGGEGGEWEDGEGGEGGTTNAGGGGGSCSIGAGGGGGGMMLPGRDCIDCHLSGEGPNFEAAATVMPAYDEPNGCVGVDGVLVRITEASGDVIELQTNGAGNFYTTKNIQTPYTAEVELDGVILAMVSPQTETDCAVCHTESGANGAPGRIIAP